MNEYKKQANDFLEATGTTCTITLVGKGFHFPDDEEKRDIYSVTLSNSRGEYRFEFGDSLHNSRKRDTRGHSSYQPGIKKADRWQKPDAYSILACLTKYDPYTFESFCADYGYNEDSRKALDTYLAVQKEWEAVQRLFTNDQIELLAEIQ
jgi:hypothetical protein